MTNYSGNISVVNTVAQPITGLRSSDGGISYQLDQKSFTDVVNAVNAISGGGGVPTTVVLTLTGATLVQSAATYNLPITITLKSSAGGRSIQLSTDGGTEYFTPTPNTTTSDMLVLVSTAFITHIKATGQSGDSLIIIY